MTSDEYADAVDRADHLRQEKMPHTPELLAELLAALQLAERMICFMQPTIAKDPVAWLDDESDVREFAKDLLEIRVAIAKAKGMTHA